MAHTRRYKGEKILPNIQIKHTIGDILLPLEGINNIPNPVTGKYFTQARFYDPAYGRMLAPDPVKRGLNGYPYCGNDPVNYVDPTGEVASILAGGILGGIMGGTLGFAGSAISQIVGGKEFDVREALGAGASGMVVGAVRGALVGSGAGLPWPLYRTSPQGQWEAPWSSS